MNEILPIDLQDLRGRELADQEGRSMLDILERMIHVDPSTGDLIIQNGRSRIVLMSDGTVRVSGKRIVQEAEESFDIQAATIDLN